MSIFKTQYDLIVVGGGHAGCEAALAGSKLGKKTLLVTMNMQTIAQMSCNPAMGGIAKGQIIREIDAMGGGSGIITDKTMIQFKMLNKSKGPAMWSPRSQNDRMRFAEEWRLLLESQENIGDPLPTGRGVWDQLGGTRAPPWTRLAPVHLPYHLPESIYSQVCL